MSWFKTWQRAAQNHRALADTYLSEVIFWAGIRQSNVEQLMLLAVQEQHKAFRCTRKMLHCLEK